MSVDASLIDLLPEDELRLLAAGDHLRPWLWLGAHPLQWQGTDGVRFAVWAPAAQRVSVVGSFNDWDADRHPMRLRGETGIWEVFVPQAAIGDFYKFALIDAQGQPLPLKADPYAFRAELRPANASIVAGLPLPVALPSGRAEANRREAPLSIYELHPASWRREGDGFPDWDLLARELPPYAAALGFTHVELLPVTEYPFDPSWGYQTLGLHAPTARLGPPEGLQRFVTACHAAGLGVLLDFVPAHFPEDPHGLARFDGSPLYEYADPREGWHQDWHTLIYDFGKPQVRQFLCGAALFWAERHGVDGLRVDAVASMLYRDYSRQPGEWIPNVHGGRENLEAVALLRRMNEILGREVPGFITIAEESTAFPLVSAPTSSGGLGFHYKWNLGWMNDTLHYMRELPIFRQWHHEKITFGLVYAFNENFVLPLSHDEVVHAKGALIAKMPADDRPLADMPLAVQGQPDRWDTPGDWQRFASLRAYYGFMWATPARSCCSWARSSRRPKNGISNPRCRGACWSVPPMQACSGWWRRSTRCTGNGRRCIGRRRNPAASNGCRIRTASSRCLLLHGTVPARRRWWWSATSRRWRGRTIGCRCRRRWCLPLRCPVGQDGSCCWIPMLKPSGALIGCQADRNPGSRMAPWCCSCRRCPRSFSWPRPMPLPLIPQFDDDDGQDPSSPARTA